MNAARVCILALVLCWAFAARADVAVPPLSGRVVDQTATLSSDDIAGLTQRLKDLETRKGSQVAILIVPTTAPETIEQFSIRVAEAWKIGRKKIDDGALLVIAKGDRKLRIEVGYGLEGALNDVTAQRIIDEAITPKFRSGDFAGGIAAGVDRIIAVIDGEPLPAPEPRQNSGSSGSIEDLFNPFLIFAVFIVGAILRATLGRLIGSVAAGGVIGVLAWFLAGSLLLSLVASGLAFVFTMVGDRIASAGGRGGFVGGGGGFSGGSSSSDSGSFSGGGGSFGGGGASGSW
ncbi:MAG TPA: YgcG family protein [Bradyrhizobium sp.]